MLSHAEFLALCTELDLSARARKLVEDARSSPPSRRVRTGDKNLTTRYPSRKMGQVIEAASHGLELPAIYQYEHDPEVLEYWDQPPPVALRLESVCGQGVDEIHRPDFLVICRRSISYEEWRTEDELKRLAATKPGRYARSEDRGWVCPPAERYTGPLGLGFRLRSSSELGPVFTRNIEFLEDYWASSCTV